MKYYFKILFISTFFILSCNELENQNISNIDFVPFDSNILLNINDLTSTNEILKLNPVISKFYSEKDLIASKINDLTIDKSKNGILSLSPFGKDQTAYTFIGKVDINDSIFDNYIFDHTYQNYDIYNKGNDKKMFMTLINDFFISSDKDIIIENIIRDFKSNKKIDKDLRKIFKTLDTSEPLNILTRSNSKSNSQFKIEEIPYFPKVRTSWVGYDFENSISELNLNGVTRISDSIDSKLLILKDIPPDNINTYKFIPETFKSFFTVTISDFERLAFNLKNYLETNNISSDGLLLDSLSIVNEVTIVSDEEDFVILGIKNIDQVQNYFDFGDINIENINSIELNDALKLILNYLNFKTDLRYSTIIDNSLIFTSSITQLRKINNLISVNKVLGFNSTFSKLINKKSEKYNFLWIANSKKVLDKNDQSPFNFDDYPFITLEGIISQDIALIKTKINKIDEFSGEGKNYTEFIVTSNNKIISNPIWLKNHLNNQYDFVFQDSQNYLYHYSNNGNLNWKKELSSRIIGEIKQIDLYKNGRLQLLFRTSEKLYLIDRNGKEVEELTFNLDTEDNLNPISVFDYEKNRNYRILISNKNQIKMYDSRGKIVSGFKPVKFDSNIKNSPVHIRIKGKDYIVFQLENGEVKILNRRGEDRIIINQKIQFSDNSFYSYLDTFTTSDNQGNLIQIDTNGNLKRTKLNLLQDNYINILNNNLVYFTENTLTIKGINVKLPVGRYTMPKLFNLNNKLLVGITDLSDDNIYLYNDDAKLIEGFPIRGSSSFDIIDSDKDGKLEIISRIDEYSVLSYEIN